MKRRTVLSAATFFISILLTLSFSSVYAKDVRGVTDDTIKVGIIADLSGPATVYSLQIIEGIKNYTRYVHEKGNIHGRKIKFITEDSHYTVPGSIAGFKKLVFRDKIFALLYGSDSGSMKVLEGRCDKNKVPFITSALSDTMAPPFAPFSRYTFFGVGAYSEGIVLMLDYIMNDLGEKDPKIAYIGPDNEMGSAGLKICRKYAKAHGFELTNTEVLSPGAMDATSQVLNTKKAKAEYVIIHSFYGPTAAFLKGCYKFAYSPKKVFGGATTCGVPTVQLAGKAAKNFMATSYFSLWFMDGPGLKKMREITLKYKPGTEKPYRDWVYTHGWVMATLLERALKGAGTSLTPEAVVNELESLRDFDTDGLSGPYTCTPDDHHGFKYNRLYKADIEKTLLVPVTGWRKVNLP